MSCSPISINPNLECSDKSLNFSQVLFIKKSDCIHDEHGNFVRMKRSYGKYKRPVVKFVNK